MKSILLKVTEEEYEVLRDLAIKDAITNNKRISLSAYTASILKNHINGNKPPPDKPHIETTQEPVIEAPKNLHEDINWDF